MASAEFEPASPPHGAPVPEKDIIDGRRVFYAVDVPEKGWYKIRIVQSPYMYDTAGVERWDGEKWARVEGGVNLGPFLPKSTFYKFVDSRGPEGTGGKRRRGKKKTRKGTRKSRRTTRRNRFT